MLLQSRGERICVFPAVPKEWPEAVFHQLRSEGGFLVSAVRERGVPLGYIFAVLRVDRAESYRIWFHHRMPAWYWRSGACPQYVRSRRTDRSIWLCRREKKLIYTAIIGADLRLSRSRPSLQRRGNAICSAAASHGGSMEFPVNRINAES